MVNARFLDWLARQPPPPLRRLAALHGAARPLHARRTRCARRSPPGMPRRRRARLGAGGLAPARPSGRPAAARPSSWPTCARSTTATMRAWDAELPALLDGLRRYGVADRRSSSSRPTTARSSWSTGCCCTAPTCYDELLRVPLIVAGPGVAAGTARRAGAGHRPVPDAERAARPDAARRPPRPRPPRRTGGPDGVRRNRRPGERRRAPRAGRRAPAATRSSSSRPATARPALYDLTRIPASMTPLSAASRRWACRCAHALDDLRARRRRRPRRDRAATRAARPAARARLRPVSGHHRAGITSGPSPAHWPLDSLARSAPRTV